MVPKWSCLDFTLVGEHNSHIVESSSINTPMLHSSMVCLYDTVLVLLLFRHTGESTHIYQLRLRPIMQNIWHDFKAELMLKKFSFLLLS